MTSGNFMMHDVGCRIRKNTEHALGEGGRWHCQESVVQSVQSPACDKAAGLMENIAPLRS